MDDDEQLPFASHLKELRRRLFFVLLFVGIAFTAVFVFVADEIVIYLQAIARSELPKDFRFTVIHPLETFSTTMRVSMYASMVCAYPWVMLQLYLFVAPGLYRQERRFFQVAIPLVFFLFTAGAAFGRYILLPISIPFLLDFNVENFNVEQNYTLASFLSLVFALSFGLGFVFQIPLLVAPLVRFGLVTPEFFKSKRRYLILASLIVGAAISPTGNPLDMLLAGGPVYFLVEGGVLAGKIWKARVLKGAEKKVLQAAKRGEKLDIEALAGGLAVDLEKKIRGFADGGARELARELFRGLKSGGEDASSLFDDEYTDDAEAPEVTLKPAKDRSRKKKPAASAASGPTVKADQVFQAAKPADPSPEQQGAAEEPETGDPEDHPEHGLDERIVALIDDRISKRIEQVIEREIRPLTRRLAQIQDIEEE